MRSFADDHRGPYIKMFSGRKFYLDDPRAEDMHVDDIARNLAGINRYTGSSRFSVAQHCVVSAVMAKIHYPEEKLLAARMLVHDASEAYYGDVSSPLKSLIPDYRNLEDRAQLEVEKKFDITFLGERLVKEVDFRMWLTEREFLFNGRHGATADYAGPLKPFADADFLLGEWPAEFAEEQWLIAHKELFWDL